MKSLVIGASGQVGKSLMRLLGDDAVGTAHTRATGKLIPLDLSDAVSVTRLIADLKPAHIYVPGGVTAVDWCETHEEEARKICVDGTVAVRDAAQGVGAHVVFFSTDYVFSGKAGPYKATDPPDAISVYGRVKAEAERAAGPFAVIRTSMVFSDEPDSKNFHNYVRDTLRGGGVVRAFTDQAGNPTWAPPLAACAILAMSHRVDGIAHVAGPEVLTRFDFARRVARTYGLDEARLKAVTTEEMPMAAARPKNGGLVLDAAASVVPSVDRALEIMSNKSRTRT